MHLEQNLHIEKIKKKILDYFELSMVLFKDIGQIFVMA
jgi:hypothetical protein